MKENLQIEYLLRLLALKLLFVVLLLLYFTTCLAKFPIKLRPSRICALHIYRWSFNRVSFCRKTLLELIVPLVQMPDFTGLCIPPWSLNINSLIHRRCLLEKRTSNSNIESLNTCLLKYLKWRIFFTKTVNENCIEYLGLLSKCSYILQTPYKCRTADHRPYSHVDFITLWV